MGAPDIETLTQRIDALTETQDRTLEILDKTLGVLDQMITLDRALVDVLDDRGLTGEERTKRVAEIRQWIALIVAGLGKLG